MAGQQFYFVRGAPQVIRLARREGNNFLTPTGSYCCTVPTTGGDKTLCANLGEWNYNQCLTLSTITTLFLMYHAHNPYVPPSTVAMPCSDDLPAISNGAITYGGGATVIYSCFGLYTLVGVSVRTCGSNGEWSSTTAPTCQRKWNGLCTVCLLSVSSPIQLTALTFPH